ncbi:MAG TPA: thymidine kinase, partial [Bacillota bacterium]
CRIVDDMGIPVIAYGLRSDFRGNLFPGSEALLALADSIEELKTICWCGKKAIMNTRLLNGKAVYEGEQVQIGGNESYISLCRKHWREGKVKP